MPTQSTRVVIPSAVGAFAAAVFGLFAPRVALVGWLTVVAPLTAAVMAGAMLACMLKLGRSRLLDAWQAPLAAAVRCLWFMPLLCLPVVFGVHTLYGWDTDPSFDAQRGYLNVPFFVVRALIYFGVWIGVAIALQTSQRPLRIALTLLILFAVANLTGIDWIMALTPTWHSSDFGLRWCLDGLLICAAAALAWHALRVRGTGEDDLRARIDGATMLFALDLGWLYLAFVDYVTAWSGNLPDEAMWYAPRIAGAWGGIAAGMIGAHVIVAALLLSRLIKRSPDALWKIAALVILAQWVETLWSVVPGLRVNAAVVVGVSLVALAAIVGVSLAAGKMLRRWTEARTAHG